MIQFKRFVHDCEKVDKLHEIYNANKVVDFTIKNDAIYSVDRWNLIYY